MLFSKLLLTLLGSLLKFQYGLANKPMAVLYENGDKTGQLINYYEDLEDFGHIQKIVDYRNLSGISLLCATGVFILYNEEEFDCEKDDQIRILAGTNTCLPPGSVKSLMFAQSTAETTLDMITTFSNERFGGGLPLKINRLNEYNDASVMMMGDIKSFILMGNSGWTVTTRYRKFCIKPGQSMAYPVCPVPYARDVFMPEEESWLSVRQGCDESDSELSVHPLSYCFNHGGGKLEKISSAETTHAPPETVARSVDTVKHRSLHSCHAIDELAMLIKLRLTHDFDSLYQVQFPLNKAHSWRTEILDNTMEIVDACMFDELVDRKLLRYVREMYIYLAEKVSWSQGRGWPTKPRQRILLMGHETSRCLTHMSETNWVNVPLKLSEDVLRNIDRPEFKDKDIDPVFLPTEGHGMEFIWLSINYVGAACHAALEYETDFWLDYMNVAYDMYLRPMAEYWRQEKIHKTAYYSKQWRNPENVLSYYPIVLGGFGIEKQYRGFAAATTSLYQSVLIDKLERPVEVQESG